MGGLISLSFVYMLMQIARGPLQMGAVEALAPEWLRQKTLPLDRLVLNDIGPEIALKGLKNIAGYVRSEEHTSQLQSRGHLVCRLLRDKNHARTVRRHDHP